jgi:hypothetical protein
MLETGTRLVLPYVPSSVGQFLSFYEEPGSSSKKEIRHPSHLLLSHC